MRACTLVRLYACTLLRTAAPTTTLSHRCAILSLPFRSMSTDTAQYKVVNQSPKPKSFYTLTRPNSVSGAVSVIILKHLSRGFESRPTLKGLSSRFIAFGDSLVHLANLYAEE